MSSTISEPLAVRDRGRVVVVRTYDDLKKLVKPHQGVRALGLSKTILDAGTDKEKADAVRAFRAWARVAGMLEKEALQHGA